VMILFGVVVIVAGGVYRVPRVAGLARR